MRVAKRRVRVRRSALDAFLSGGETRQRPEAESSDDGDPWRAVRVRSKPSLLPWANKIATRDSAISELADAAQALQD